MLQGLPLYKVPLDGNRMDFNVLYGELDLTEEAAKVVSDKVPQGRFLNGDQLDILPLNGHLHIALSVTEGHS